MRFTQLLLLFLAVGVLCAPPQQHTFAADPATAPSLETGIRLDFPANVELKVVIDYVSERLNLNVVYDEQTVNQKITLKTPVAVPASSLLDVLGSALQAKGLVMIDGPKPGWKRIVAVSGLAAAAAISATQPSTQPGTTQPGARLAEGMTQVFVLQNADPSKVDPVIKPFITTPGGNSIALTEQHVLIVSDYASNIARIGELVRLLDQPQRKVETRFVAVQHLDASQLAQQLTTLLASRSRAQGSPAAAATAGGAVGATGVEIVPESRTNQLILIGSADAITSAVELAHSLDVPLDLRTATYQFNVISPDRVDKLVRDLLGATEVKRIYQSSMDKDAGVLVVTSTSQVQTQVDLLKRQLDVAGAAEEQSPIRFYKLQNTTASEVLQTIQAITGEGDPTFDGGGSRVASNDGLAHGQRRGASDSRDGESRPNTDLAAPPPAYSGARAADAQQLTAAANEPLRGTVHAKDATITVDPNTNSVIVVAKPEAQRLYEQLIKMLDKRRPQVLVECTIVTLDTSNNFSLAVEVAVRAGSDKTDLIGFSSFGLSRVGSGTADLGRLTLNPGLGFNGTVINADVAQLAIRALASSGRAEVVSAPKLVVNDNTPGTLASVQEAPFTSVNASNTVATTAFAGYASAGTTITVTPHISEGDFLQLEYTVALNSFTGAANSNAGTPPPRQTNELSSKVTIPDGSTIIVGGLNRKNYSTTVDAVPILGQIPILEYLFSSRTENRSNSTLFVFIRPVVLRDDKFADLKFFSERDVKAAGIADDYPKSEPMIMK